MSSRANMMAKLFLLAGAALSVGTCNLIVGKGGFGPTSAPTDITVLSKHIDVSGSGDSRESHYMVQTDKGGYEVDNGLLLGVWNADEIYGNLQPQHSYRVVAKGRKSVNFFFQNYPFIVSATEITNNVEKGR